MNGPSQLPSRSQRRAENVTLALTHLIKLVGVASAFNQLLIQAHPTSLALGLSAFMIAGGQLSEGLLLSVLDRVMGNERRPPSEPPS